MLKIQLDSVNTFEEYISSLDQHHEGIIVMLAVCDDSSKHYVCDDFGFLKKHIPDTLGYRQGFTAIIDCSSDNCVSKIGKAVSVEYEIGGTKLAAFSKGYISWSETGYAYFIINGHREELLGNRGMNVCVVSKEDGSLIDCMFVDMFDDPSLLVRRYRVSNVVSLAEAGDARAQALAARMFRDRPDKDLDSAIYWMKKAYQAGKVPANELYDLLHSRVVSDIGNLEELTRKAVRNGDARSMNRLGRMYAEGLISDPQGQLSTKYLQMASGLDKAYRSDYMKRLLDSDENDARKAMEVVVSEFECRAYADFVYQSFKNHTGIGRSTDFVIEWLRRSNPSVNPGLMRSYVEVLMHRRTDDDVAELISLYHESKSPYVASQLSRLKYNGFEIPIPDSELKIHTLQYMSETCPIRTSWIVNPVLFDYPELIVAGSQESIYWLLAVCIQYNIVPSKVLAIDSSLTSDLELPLEIVDETSIVPGSCILALSDESRKIRKLKDNELFFLNSGKKQRPILIRNPLFKGDMVEVEPGSYESGNLRQMVSFDAVNRNGSICTFKDGIFDEVELNSLFKSISNGHVIYDGLDEEISWIFPRWDNIGDVFKIVSLVGSYKEHRGKRCMGVIVRDRLQGISNLFDSVDKEVSLDWRSYTDLRNYVLFNAMYDGKIRYCSPLWMYGCGVTNTGSVSVFLPLPNHHYMMNYESDRFKSLMGLPTDALFERIESGERKRTKKVLLNPYGGWIFRNNEDLSKKIFVFMEKLASLLATKGFDVYTNVHKTDALKKTEPFDVSVCELARRIGEFHSVVSVCTGLTDMIAMTSCDLHVIYPNDSWSIQFSRRRIVDRDNIFEYVWDDTFDQLARSIVSRICGGP